MTHPLGALEQAFYSSEMRATDGTGQQGHVPPQHVWVCLTGNWSTASPGVLLDWRKGKGGRWEAFVIRASGGGNHEVYTTMGWVQAEHVRPAEGR